jgi:hypothetical protein
MAALEEMPKGARHRRSAPPGCRNRAEQWAAKQWRTPWQLTRLTIPAPRACKLMKHRIQYRSAFLICTGSGASALPRAAGR